MKRKSALFIIALLLLYIGTDARPARCGLIQLQQPDGSIFGAYFSGDEFMRIKTTESGNAIIQDQDGWWCYANYGSDGRISCSGFRVGGKVPSSVLAESRAIPYGILAEKAASKRSICAEDELKPLIKRIMEKAGPDVRAGEQKGSKHGLVILAQYQDVKFRYSKESFVNMLTQEGYRQNGATGSAKEYFDAQFNGAMDFSFTVSEIVTLSKKRAYYGGNDSYGNDKNAAEMIQEACILADNEIDFSLYDDDGDGTVDNVFVFFAGGDEAEGAGEDCIWSHAWYIYSGAGISLRLDGKRIDRYACTSELTRTGTTQVLAGIGTFCHEYSHTFGLPDLYDTDYDDKGGWAAGLWGRTALMDSGNQNNNGNTPPYFNAIEREILGIGSPIMIENDGTYTLEPINLNGAYCRLDTDTPGEYYLIECRSSEGWDAWCGGNGMLVYHIDKSPAYLKRWEQTNTVNAYRDHQCADLIEADGRANGFTSQSNYISLMRNIKGVFFPYGSVTQLTPQSNPGLKFWSGNPCSASITGIRLDGNRISFGVTGLGSASTPPVPEKLKAEPFADAAIITFESSRPYSSEATVTWGKSSQENKVLKVKPYQSGKYAVVLEGLEPGNKTYTINVHFEIGELKGESKSTSFMTTRQSPVSWPYIFLSKSVRSGSLAKGTRIPLRVYNASGAAEIKWTFNGQPVTPEPDGRFTITSDGILRANIQWKDGSVDIIEKSIKTGQL